MKKILIIILTLSICLFFLIFLMSSEFKKLEHYYSSKIGSKFILNKDTLTIIDYSVFKESFTLSNGQEINFHLINNGKETK